MDETAGKKKRAQINYRLRCNIQLCVQRTRLPKDGASNKEVFLPDNLKLKTSHKTKLPFKRLSDAVREAHILPGLKRSLLSVNKMSEEGHTTIFHPGEE